MEPTPPPINPVNVLMADIAIITQYVRAYNKRPFPATEDQVKGLVKLAERDRPLVVNVKTEEVVEQLAGRVQELNKGHVATTEQLIARFAKNAILFSEMVENDTVTMKNELATGVKAVEAATVDMNAGAARIPSKITVDFAQGWRWVAGLVLGPVAFLLLGMGWAGQFSKVDKEAYERVKADYEQMKVEDRKLKTTNGAMGSDAMRYEAQIKRYRAKNPKTTDFPR